MNFYCKKCGKEIDLIENRVVSGKILYSCPNCGSIQKKCDMRTEAQIARKANKKIDRYNEEEDEV